MLKSEFNSFVSKKLGEIVTLGQQGQSEYAQGQDAFDNFNRLAVELGMDRKAVLMVYFSKHRDGVLSYLKGHKSQREPVQGRIKDMIVYLLLLWAMVEEEEASQKTIDYAEKRTGVTKTLIRYENEVKDAIPVNIIGLRP